MNSTTVVRTHSPSLLRDLVMLTKPRIISLLLVTTIAPMFVAGTPSFALVIAVAIGGYLMAGGANAVNMYIDRDIDDRMARTRLRPIPSGRMDAVAVLAFGVALATAATALLAAFVNLLAAALALAGFYFYVFVYSRWLKRSTPQNIVIGGAAGAFPPLVGWSAVTGSLDLTALYLFLIVFYWTPPHFWALALLKQTDYGRAGVPMAPLVWGERETMHQNALVHGDPHSPHALAGDVRRVRDDLSRIGRSARAGDAVEHRAHRARDSMDAASLVVLPLFTPLPRAPFCGNGRGQARRAVMTPAEWRDTLVVQIAGKEGQAPSIIELERPVGGRVRAREWPDGEWTLPARESRPSCEELVARFDRARKEGRQVSEDTHRIRAWLEGRA